MAWVNLCNLFEDDKNFYGLLNDALELNVNVKLGEKVASRLKEGSVEVIGELDGKRLKDILKSEIGGPEWTLNREGKLMNFEFFELDGKMGFHDIVEIDISEWLATLPEGKLKAIADCGFTDWIREEKDYEPPVCHPQWLTDTYWRENKKRDLEAQKEFFANIEAKKHKKEMAASMGG